MSETIVKLKKHFQNALYKGILADLDQAESSSDPVLKAYWLGKAQHGVMLAGDLNLFEQCLRELEVANATYDLGAGDLEWIYQSCLASWSAHNAYLLGAISVWIAIHG